VNAPRPAWLTYGRSLAGVVAAGAALRLGLLARQPLGYDEDFTAAVVTRPFGEMISAVSRDSGPPLFYAVEWPIAHICAEPWALRLVPALAGIALIPLLAALGRRVADDAAGLWAAAVAAFLPATVLVSLNARMYAPAGTLVVAALLLGCRAIEAPSWRSDLGRWIAYGLVAAAAVWTDYFAVLALLGVLLALTFLRPPGRTLVRATLATGAAIASLGAWFLVAGEQFAHAGQGFWVRPLDASGFGTLVQLFAGPPVNAGVPGSGTLVTLQGIAILAGLAALLAAAAWTKTAGPAAARRVAFMLVACSGVVMLVLASLWRPIFEARYAGVMWLPLFALAGVGLAAIPRRLAALTLLAMAVPSLALGTTITHPETESLLPDIESRVGPVDLVAADPNHYLVLLSEGGPELQERLYVVATAPPPWYFGTAAYPDGAVIGVVPADVIQSGGTIFWVASPDVSLPGLPAGYRQTERRCVVGACLTIFEPSP